MYICDFTFYTDNLTKKQADYCVKYNGNDVYNIMQDQFSNVKNVKVKMTIVKDPNITFHIFKKYSVEIHITGEGILEEHVAFSSDVMKQIVESDFKNITKKGEKKK